MAYIISIIACTYLCASLGKGQMLWVMELEKISLIVNANIEQI